MHRNQVLLSSLVALCLLSAIGFWLFNRGYGEVSSQAYDYSIALFSACNQRDVDRLQTISRMIESDLDAGKLNTNEARWLQGIIDKGKQGAWEAANRDVRQLMTDQLRKAP